MDLEVMCRLQGADKITNKNKYPLPRVDGLIDRP